MPATDKYVQNLRTSTPNAAPANGALAPGQFSVEMADPMKLWVGVDVGLGATGNRKLLFDSSAYASVSALGNYLPLAGGVLNNNASNPLSIVSPAGQFPRIRYTVGTARTWYAGLNSGGEFTISDDTASRTPLVIDLGGTIKTSGYIQIPNNASILTFLANGTTAAHMIGYNTVNALAIGVDSNDIVIGSGTGSGQVSMPGTLGVEHNVSVGQDLYLYRLDQPRGYVVRPNQAGFRNLGFSCIGATNLDTVVIQSLATQVTGGVTVEANLSAQTAQVGAANYTSDNPFTVVTAGTNQPTIRYRRTGAREWVVGQGGGGDFFFYDVTADQTRMTINTAGNVSIPAQLFVTGNATFSTNVYIGGQGVVYQNYNNATRVAFNWTGGQLRVIIDGNDSGYVQRI